MGPTLSTLDSPRSLGESAQTGFTLSSNTRRVDEVSPKMFKGGLMEPSFRSVAIFQIHLAFIIEFARTQRHEKIKEENNDSNQHPSYHITSTQ